MTEKKKRVQIDLIIVMDVQLPATYRHSSICKFVETHTHTHSFKHKRLNRAMERKRSTLKCAVSTLSKANHGTRRVDGSERRGIEVGDLLDVLSEWCEWRLRRCYAIARDLEHICVGEPFKTRDEVADKGSKESREWVALSSHRIAMPLQVPNPWLNQEGDRVYGYPLLRHLSDTWYQAIDFVRRLKVDDTVDAARRVVTGDSLV